MIIINNAANVAILWYDQMAKEFSINECTNEANNLSMIRANDDYINMKHMLNPSFVLEGKKIEVTYGISHKKCCSNRCD